MFLRKLINKLKNISFQIGTRHVLINFNMLCESVQKLYIFSYFSYVFTELMKNIGRYNVDA